MTSTSRRIVVATSNPGKAQEIGRILNAFRVTPLPDEPKVLFPDEGGDYFENARAKAIAAARALGQVCVADDSGLEVEALDGAPGAYSARYGGAGLDDRGRLKALLGELKEVASPRRARFFCVAAVASPDGRCAVAEGVSAGVIVQAARGDGGFGYDPIFQPDGFDRVMAELSREEKDGLSHRGQAFRALESVLDDFFDDSSV